MPPAKKAKLTGGKTGGNSLEGLTFAITGPLSQPRKHFEDLISSNGGRLAGSVTKAVDYLITTEGEIHVDTTKVQEARVKGLPMLGEEVLTDAIATGAFPDDLTDYVLKGSPPLKKTAGKKATAAAAASTGPKKTRAVKSLEEADAEVEAAAPKAKAATAKATAKPTAKATTTKAAAKGGEALAGCVFAITGALSLPRKDFENLITANGGRVSATVTKAVQYVITTDEEIAVNPTKIQEAKVKGLPMVSEDVLSAAIKAGAMPDLTPYLLTGSPSAAPASAAATAAAAKKATAAKAAAAGKKATAAKSTAAVEDDDEEEEEVKPKRGAAAKKSAKKASAAMDVDEPAAAPAPKTTAAAKRTAKETAAAPSRASTTSSAEPTLTRAPTTLDMTEKKSEVVFSFDTTGSMYPCLTQVRRKIQECVKRLFDEIGRDNLRIGITAHGDYCDAGMTYVTKHLPMTDDLNKIVNFVENVSGTGGGDAPECYELVLHEALSYNWTKGWNHVLVLIGDELPHEANANPGKLDWKEECKKLQAAGVQVHGVQALNRKHATKFYAGIANLTGGVHLPLDQFSAITDLVVAVCFREARPAQLEKFEKEVQAGGRYNRTIQVMFDRMLGRTTKAGEAPGDMNAVHAGRFQVLDVDHDVSIKDFVLAQGVTFKTGRGFYEFTKPETIQGYKEIILMDPSSGEMFEGDYARTLINAPAGVSARVVPKDLDFIPFIQSTSHNRKLIGGTRFLYEIEEGF